MVRRREISWHVAFTDLGIVQTTLGLPRAELDSKPFCIVEEGVHAVAVELEISFIGSDRQFRTTFRYRFKVLKV